MDKKSERKRVAEIMSVFIKYGIKEGITNITNPEYVRRAIEELGPTFIKIGQILSTRPDILPENYLKEFCKLQDNVKPENFEEIKELVERELGGNIKEIFLSFDEVPIASASLAQVHRAQLKNGDCVVVKVQRPKARETMMSDIKILRRLSPFLKFTAQGQVIDPREMIEELMEAAKSELDFLNEAHNIEKFLENNLNEKYITCPDVYKDYTTSRVLAMQYIEGIKIADNEKLKSEGYEFDDIAEKLVNNYVKQIFEDGFFHADPHPGNILISEHKIVYIDFGIMGTLSKGMQNKFNSFLHGIATKNIDSITQSVVRIGIKKGNVDIRKLHSDIEQIYNSYIEESLYDLDLPQLIDEIFKACRKNNIAIPREITMFIKGIMTIEGVVLKLAPDMNIMDIVVPYIKRRMISERNIKKDIEEQLENIYTLSRMGLKLPIKTLELINSALAGKLKVQMEHTNLDTSISELNRMVNRIVFGIITASLIIGSSLVIRADRVPKGFNISILGFVGYTGAAVLGFWLIISILRSGKM